MCNLKIGQRGRAEIVVETFGVPAHSANPEKGVNAVYSMCKVVEAIRSLKPVEHPVLGKGILELTDIKSTPYPGASVFPPTAAPPMTGGCWWGRRRKACWHLSRHCWTT